MDDFIELARLLEHYAAAQIDFTREHRLDYNSDRCGSAYERQEKILERLDDHFHEVVRRKATELAIAIRAAARRD